MSGFEAVKLQQDQRFSRLKRGNTVHYFVGEQIDIKQRITSTIVRLRVKWKQTLVFPAYQVFYF